MKLKQSRKKAKDIIETINTKKSSGSKITSIFEEPIQQRTSKVYTLPDSKQGRKSQIEKGANTKAELPKLSSSLDDKNEPPVNFVVSEELPDYWIELVERREVSLNEIIRVLDKKGVKFSRDKYKKEIFQALENLISFYSTKTAD